MSGDDGLLFCLVRIIAFVGHADDLIAEAEQVNDLGGTGQ